MKVEDAKQKRLLNNMKSINMLYGFDRREKGTIKALSELEKKGYVKFVSCVDGFNYYKRLSIIFSS